mgnify:CR=1 FL=1
MKLIVISGPSGSGKTTLSKIIVQKLKDGIILNTDNYYKTGIISQILSKTVNCYFDRRISFNYRLFKKDLEFILKNRFSTFSYEYNFKAKSIKKIYKKTKNIKFVIIEGIFGQETIKYFSADNCILINLKTDKQSCMERVIKRDFEERGKNKYLAKKDFLKAWDLFYKNKKKSNQIDYLKKIMLENKSEISSLLKDLTNIMN